MAEPLFLRTPDSQVKALRKTQGRRLLVIAAAALAFATFGFVAYIALNWHFAIARPSDVVVCQSSMSGRLAHDMILAYAQQNPDSKAHLDKDGAHCDITFGTMEPARHSARDESPPSTLLLPQTSSVIIAHDAVVGVVSLQNPVNQLSLKQLHGILTGRINNWSNIGGRGQPISVILPNDSTDEAHIVAQQILGGAPVGSSVYRVPSSADVLRVIGSPIGRYAIGMVALSSASSVKIIDITSFQSASANSIRNRRYPLVVDVSARASRVDDSVSKLLAFAVSSTAKKIAAREGLFP